MDLKEFEKTMIDMLKGIASDDEDFVKMKKEIDSTKSITEKKIILEKYKANHRKN